MDFFSFLEEWSSLVASLIFLAHLVDLLLVFGYPIVQGRNLSKQGWFVLMIVILVMMITSHLIATLLWVLLRLIMVIFFFQAVVCMLQFSKMFMIGIIWCMSWHFWINLIIRLLIGISLLFKNSSSFESSQLILEHYPQFFFFVMRSDFLIQSPHKLYLISPENLNLLHCFPLNRLNHLQSIITKNRIIPLIHRMGLLIYNCCLELLGNWRSYFFLVSIGFEGFDCRFSVDVLFWVGGWRSVSWSLCRLLWGDLWFFLVVGVGGGELVACWAEGCTAIFFHPAINVQIGVVGLIWWIIELIIDISFCLINISKLLNHLLTLIFTQVGNLLYFWLDMGFPALGIQIVWGLRVAWRNPSLNLPALV